MIAGADKLLSVSSTRKMNQVIIALLVLAAAAAPAKADYEIVESFTPSTEDFKYVYFVSDSQLNWYLAKKDCVLRGLKLASIMTSDENELLKNALSQRLGDGFWISLNDHGSENVWYWDSNGSPLSFSNWGNNEPDQIGSERCAQINANSRTWDNYPCGHTKKYVCEGYLPRN